MNVAKKNVSCKAGECCEKLTYSIRHIYTGTLVKLLKKLSKNTLMHLHDLIEKKMKLNFLKKIIIRTLEYGYFLCVWV